MKRVRRTKKDVQSVSHPNQLPPADNHVENDDKNPMLKDVILGHLFEVITFSCQDFKNFRQVSKLWLKTSLGRWRQEVWLHVRDGKRREIENIGYVCSYVFYNHYLEMLSLPGDPHQLMGKYAFKKYILSSARGASNIKFFSEEALIPFWSKVGPSITHLEVFSTDLGNGELFMRVLTVLVPNMTFLSLKESSVSVSYPYTDEEMMDVNVPARNKKLQPETSEVRINLTHLEITFKASKRDFGVSWAYFFLRFPNIQTLKLRDVLETGCSQRSDTLDEMLLIFESLESVRANGNPGTLSRLENLDLLNLNREPVQYLRPYFLNSLTVLAFPLSSLSIDIGFEPEQEQTGFKRILELYSLTLQKLLIYRGPYEKPFAQTFPFGVALPNLEELRLIGPICRNLHFLKNTPSLKTLVLLDGQIEMETKVLHSYVDFYLPRLSSKTNQRCIHFVSKVDIIASTNFASGPLKNLVLPQMHEFIVEHELCDGSQVGALVKLMPGLKKLRIGLGNEGFGAACKSWTELRHLDIEPFDVEEEGILGMKDGKKYSRPNITDLKYLTSLRMGVHSNDSEKERLTNGSIVDGLLVAERLRSVWYRVKPKATAKVLKLLDSKFPQ